MKIHLPKYNHSSPLQCARLLYDIIPRSKRRPTRHIWHGIDHARCVISILVHIKIIKVCKGQLWQNVLEKNTINKLLEYQ